MLEFHLRIPQHVKQHACLALRPGLLLVGKPKQSAPAAYDKSYRPFQSPASSSSCPAILGFWLSYSGHRWGRTG